MRADRPIFISVIQYLPLLEAGTMSISEYVNKGKEFGVDGVELRRECWPAYKTELPAVRKQLEDLGLLVTFATFTTLFTKDDAAQRQFLEDIEIAQALGSPLLRVFLGQTPADLNDEGWAKARQAVDYATERGVEISLENFFGSPGGTLSEIANALEQIPALKTNIDIGNYPGHNVDVVEAFRQIGHRANYIHLKDYAGSPNARAIYGEGVLDLPAIFAAIDALPQRLPLCFEFSGGDDPDGRIRNALSLTRKLLAQS